MKVYIQDFNNILQGIKSKVDLASNPREADLFILWQDVRGGMYELAKINKDYLHKPCVVVQHGRGAARDYSEPNNFPLLADRLCLWGEREASYIPHLRDRIRLTGSPIYNLIKDLKKDDHKERFVLLTPTITSHEEPDNINLYFELKKIEFEYAQEEIRKAWSRLKTGWHSWLLDPDTGTDRSIPYDLLRRNFYLISKLTDIHDKQLYQGPVARTSPGNVVHLQNTIKVIQNSDCVVSYEESTPQLIACYLGIPTVCVEGFDYGNYGGCKDYGKKLKFIKTNSAYWTQMDNLKDSIEHALQAPEELSAARKEVISTELKPDNIEDPDEAILDVASELVGQDVRKQELVLA